MSLIFLQSLLQLLFDIIFAPIWWYSAGLLRFGRWLAVFEKNRFDRVGVLVWIHNLFVPMFGDYTKSGRAISFFMRVVQIILRSTLILFYTLVAFVMLCVYLALPVFVVYEIYLQLA